ncbi:MAG: ABC transporter ATP-binding protein, partial [Clostridia bacterium]|nr:ABC transporter ATP-binding protein [Clostridia bacterium]
DSGKIIADDTPRNIGKLLYEQNNPMFTAMPTPVRVFYNADGDGDCPLTVREGRAWLSKEFESEPKIKEIPCKNIDDDIENPALSLKELWFRYEKDTPDILRGVSLDIPKGSISAIVGGNGAGKSTTLKAICGICKPYRGKIKVFGKPVNKFRSGELFKNCISMLPQDPKSLFVKNKVSDELSEMTKDKNKINEVAETCQITELMNNHPYDLSGGEQQRVALAKVLLTELKILLLDEPTKGMDSFFKKMFATILNKLKSQGITILMVSHDVEFCAKYADRVSMFFDGQVLTTETPQNFFGGNSFYTTAANRMSKHIFKNAVTAENVVELYRKNKGGTV